MRLRAPSGPHVEIPERLPVLPVRDLVVFPLMIAPLFVDRDVSVAAINAALRRDRLLFIATQRDAAADEPDLPGLYPTGTVALIMRMRKTPDGRVKILVQGLVQGELSELERTDSHYQAHIRTRPDAPSPADAALDAVVRQVKGDFERLAAVGREVSADTTLVAQGIDEPGRLADLVASHLSMEIPEAQSVLAEPDGAGRLRRVGELLARRLELLDVQSRIETQTRAEISRTQHEYYLRQQLKQIQSELGEISGELEDLRDLGERIGQAHMPEEAEREAHKQLRRLENLSIESAEASIIRTYLDWMVELPWAVLSVESLDLKAARAILDQDHFGLAKVKERLLDYLGVRKLKPDKQGPILCFVGPPGVGKTSLGRSIARSLGRKFVRISLGGVRDEAEIRGHRRTYVGAMPGRIIQGLKQAGTRNPVLMLDEIDKLAHDARGDPAAALLEVLDPEQNAAFRDHYLNLPFDLSQVMFIATANVVDPVPQALLDRLECLFLSGYTEEEKLHIARRYLVPKELRDNGLDAARLSLTDRALMEIVRSYTREAGLRNLEREIATVCRKVARSIAEGRARPTRVTPARLRRYLGAPRFQVDDEMEESAVGLATGLAWTQVGGEVLYVEATAMKGRASLRLTGQLGDVMRESAQAALSYVRSRAEQLGIEGSWFDEREIHVHVPSGATQKDGPSAGVTMAVALVSLATGRKVRRDVALTGEVTLRGRLLRVGGVKEKVLAALRAGLRTVVVPDRNLRDLDELPHRILQRLEVRPARTVEEVLAVALEPADAEADAVRVANPPAGLGPLAATARDGESS